MRASLIGTLLVALTVPSVAAETRGSTRGLACAAPTLFQCAVIVPGFTRWFVAPFGIAPSDAEMASRICGEKGLPIAAMTRKPTGSGPMSQTTAVEVLCGEPRAAAARPSPIARPLPLIERPRRDAEGERFTPSRLREGEGDSRLRPERPSRDTRDARREFVEPARKPRRSAEPVERESVVGPIPAGKPRQAPEIKRDDHGPTGPAPDAKAAPAEVRSAPEPAPQAAPARPAVPQPAPPNERAPARPAPSADPSIIYDHL